MLLSPGSFAPQGTLGNIRAHFWLLLLGEGRGDWHTWVEVWNAPEHPRVHKKVSNNKELSGSKTSIMLKLRNLDIEHSLASPLAAFPCTTLRSLEQASRRVWLQTSRNLGVQNYLLRCSGSVFFGPIGCLFERIQYSKSEDFARKSGSRACPETRKIFSHGSPVSRRQHPVGAAYQLPRALYRGRYLSGSSQPHPCSRRHLLGM